MNKRIVGMWRLGLMLFSLGPVRLVLKMGLVTWILVILWRVFVQAPDAGLLHKIGLGLLFGFYWLDELTASLNWWRRSLEALERSTWEQ